MVIIAADSSGQINVDPDVWFVAVRKTSVQEHSGMHIDDHYQKCAKRFLGPNWVEKLYAILYFRSIRTLFKELDTIQIDKDFQGKRADYIKKYTEILFIVYQSQSPRIEFVSERRSKQVKEAHLKTKKARYKSIQLDQNPVIHEQLRCLKNYTIKK